jgi:hypothetical protein
VSVAITLRGYDAMREAVTRRELFKSAAVVGAAGVVAAETGCAATPLPALEPGADPADHLDPRAADAVLASLDARLSWIDAQELPDDVVPVSRLPHDAERERCRELVRTAARSLYATGRFIDLPDELKAHPDVQAKLRSLHGDMDAAVLGMTEVLERMTPDDHRRVQRCLRDDPGFAERLAVYLERPASEDGIPFKRRFGMRATMLQLGSRMAAQSPALVTEPIVKKVRRIQARPRAEGEQLRLLAARMGQEAFWAHQEKMARLHAAWVERLGRTSPALLAVAQAEGPDGVLPGNALRSGDSATVPADAPAGTAPPPPAPVTQPAPPAPAPVAASELEAPREQDAEEAPGEGTISTGATIMGFGAGSVVLGLGFWGLAAATGADALLYPALFFGVTLGPILLVVGLVTLLVGLIIKASA